MRIYKLVCDNGQEMEMTLVNPDADIDQEIVKLEQIFPKEESSGWPIPLPTKVVSYELLS